jgi:hypothetical protein
VKKGGGSVLRTQGVVPGGERPALAHSR